MFPNKIPNLNHKIFSGFNNFEFNNPKIKKINDIIRDQILISPFLSIGHKDINKNTTKKTIPKFLLLAILIFTNFYLKLYFINNLFSKYN